jgi:hypothetical protein
MKSIKSIVLLAALLATACLSALASTPITWSAFASSWTANSFSSEIAAFTPDSAIIVTRIEMDGSGPFNFLTQGPCATIPSLTIKGGTTTYTLPFALPDLSTGINHDYTDSGRLHLDFAGGTKLTLTANGGDANCVVPSSVEIVVQYHGTDEEGQQGRQIGR